MRSETVCLTHNAISDDADPQQTINDAAHSPPSLAVILLPSRLPPVLPVHTRYLPLISPPSLDFGSSDKSQSSSFSEQVMRDTAQYAWKCLSVPWEDVIALDDNYPGNILDVTALRTMDETILSDKLSTVFKPVKSTRVRSRESEKLHTSKWYVITIGRLYCLLTKLSGTASPS